MAADGTTFPPFRTIPELTPVASLAFTAQVWVNQDGNDWRCNIGDIAALMPPHVTAFNGRTGDVDLTIDDITAAGGAPLSSPFFTNVPQAPTPPRGANDARIATAAFVQDAISTTVAGVSSWNGRVGVVTLTTGDITGAGGATAAQLANYLPLTGGVLTGPGNLTVNGALNAAGGLTSSSAVLSGDLSIGATKAAHFVWAGPTSGVPAAPAWRQLSAADITGLPPTTVTSVGLSMPADFTVANSPVTSSGTLTVTRVSQAANLVFASPDGAAGVPTYRALVGNDLPLPTTTSLGGVFSVPNTPNNWVRNIAANGTPVLSQPNFTNIAGTVAASQLPAPGAASLGGVQSAAPVAHQWINSISTAGVPALSQPAAADLSDGVTGTGAIVLANAPTLTGPVALNAGAGAGLVVSVSGTTNFNGVQIDGAVGTGRYMDFSTAGLSRWVMGAGSGAESGGSNGSNWAFTAYDDTGAQLGSVFTVVRNTQVMNIAKLGVSGSTAHGVLIAQGGATAATWTAVGGANTFLAGNAGADPSFRALTGADLPNPAAASKGGVQSFAAVAHQFLTSISTAGVPAAAQPSTADLSDVAAITAWTPALTFATPGDLVVNYSSRSGKVFKIGPLIIWSAAIVVSSLTYTTASGALQITGLPYSATVNVAGVPTIITGITWPAGAAMLQVFVNGNNIITFYGLAAGGAQTQLTTANYASGGSTNLQIFGVMF